MNTLFHAPCPQGYAVSLAERKDVPLLNAIEVAAATIFPPGTLPDHMREDKLPEETLLAAQNRKMLWVAYDARRIPVGYLLLQIVENMPLLAQIDVHPRHGRKGLGKALIAAAAGQIRSLGFAALYLTTFSGIAWNAPFYAALGFIPLDEGHSPNFLSNILEHERQCGMNDRIAMKLPLQA